MHNSYANSNKLIKNWLQIFEGNLLVSVILLLFITILHLGFILFLGKLLNNMYLSVVSIVIFYIITGGVFYIFSRINRKTGL